MKRKVVAANTMDVLGDLVSNISLEIKSSMIECGFDESDVDFYYRVELEKEESYGEYRIAVSIELSYETAANSVIPKLNRIVSSVDRDGYFDYVGGEIWECVFNVNGNTLTYKLNESVVSSCVESAVDTLNKLYETEFDVLRQSLKPSSKSSHVFDVFVCVESETMLSEATVHVDMDEYKDKGAWEVKDSLFEMLLEALRVNMEQI